MIRLSTLPCIKKNANAISNAISKKPLTRIWQIFEKPASSFSFLLSLLFVSQFFLLPNLHAQQTLPAETHQHSGFCAHDHVLERAMKQSNDVKIQHEIMERKVYDFFRSLQDDKNKKGAEKLLADYTLPVVVHVIHDGGAENISDAQVIQGIQDLNDAYANVGYYNPMTGVDTRIQFCMAQRDPDGNATLGINRVQTPLTVFDLESDDVTVKDLSRWNPLEYINIWVVRDICSTVYGCGVAGYAYFPDFHGEPEDGLMVEAEFFGSSPGASGVIAHEMGHYLGLYHTFQGGCTNNDCLNDGDRVCDTPPDQSTAAVACGGSANSCSTDANSGFSTDQDDIFEDYMDYGDFNCWSIFTDGQTERMHWHIENVRQSLLDSKGCQDPCTSGISASFSPNVFVLDAGGTVNFSNTSTNSTSANWEVNGVNFSNSINASYQFTQVGTYEVCLETGNADPNCSASFCEMIIVTCPVLGSFNSSELFPEPNEQVDFTNTSNATTVSEWSVNGVVQGTANDFSYSFPNEGAYTVCLIAGNQFCTNEFCQAIFVSNPPVLPTDCDSTFLKIYGLPNIEELGHALALVPDALGGGYLIGGGQGNVAMMTYVDNAGDIVWSRSFDATFDAADFIWSIGFDSDNNVIGVGNTRNEPADNVECFAFKYDMANNIILWINELDLNDPAQEVYYSIYEKSPGGNYIVSGHTDALAFGTTGRDAIMLELNKLTGDNIWQSNFHLGGFETYRRSILANNSLYGTGGFSANTTNSKTRPGISRIDLSGNQIWSRLYLQPVGVSDNANLQSVDIVDDNGLTVFGFGDQNGTSGTDVGLFIFRTDYDGNLLWAKEYDIAGADSEQATRMINLPDGYLCLGYFTNGDQDVFVFKTDKQGNLVWAKSYGSPGLEDGFDILWNNGLIYFTGKSDGIGGNTDLNLFLANLTADGEPTQLDNCDLFGDLLISEEDIPNAYDGQHNMTDLQQNWGRFLGVETVFETSVQSVVACGGPCAEVCDNGLDDDGDGYVDCYDVDCPCATDDCVANPSDLDQNFATKLAWQSTINEVSVDATPIVANLNPQVDSIPEIIVGESSSSITTILSNELLIFKGDGSNAASPLRLPITAGYDMYSAVNPAVGDLNGDGIPEVVITSADRRIRVYSNYNENANPPMQEIIVSNSLADDRNNKPYLADFDGDGMSEVYVGNDVFTFDAGFTSLTKTLIGNGSAGIQYYQNYQEKNCSPVAVDILQSIHCNGDPDCDGLELVAGNVIYSIDLDFGDGDGPQIKVQRDLNVMQTQFNFRDGYTSVADVDLDGILDVVVSSARGNTVGIYVWNRNGPLQWFPHQPTAVPARSGGLPTIANVYDDTQNGAAVDYPEIIVCNEKILNCYNINAANMGMVGNAWWQLPTTDASGMTGATVFDFNGDGIEEIVYRDENNLRIMYGGAAPFPAGVDTERNWETFVSGSGTFDEHPVIADVDNDGQANIILTSTTFPGTNNPPADYRGRLRVFEADLTVGDPWLSARPIWNQYNYFVVNVNDDLTMPLTQQWHHLELPDVGSGYRPLNKFVSQISLMDDNFEPFLPVPDATVSIDSFGCANDSVLLFLKICNEDGAVLLPDGTPIAFYIGDPVTTAATLHSVATLEVNVQAGSCHTQAINIPSVNGVDVFVVINDNGSAATPFDFGNDFPTTNVIECVYINNPTSVFINFSSPDLDLGPDLDMCEFGVVELDAGPGFASYEWIDGSTEQTTTIWNPGTYSVTVTDECGGTQVDEVTIVVDPATVLDLGNDIEICQGGSHTFMAGGAFTEFEWSPADYLDCTDCPNPTTTPQTNIIYTLTAKTADGCIGIDSVAVLVSPAFESTDSIEICEGETILIFGNPVDMAGTYTETFTTAAGCDSTQTFFVTVAPAFETSEERSICDGETIIIFGNPVSTAGEYSETFTTQDGCDSTHTITVSVLDNIATSENRSVCDGQTILVFGNPVGAAGDYSETFTAANGCDSVHTITVSVLDNITTSENRSVCDGQTILVFGNPVGTAGDYSETFTASNGCDSTHTITVSVLENISTEEEIAICPFTFIDIFGSLTGVPGIYSMTFTGSNGCDSTHTILLTLLEPVQVSASRTPVSCYGSSDGTITLNVSNSNGAVTYLWENGATTQTLGGLSGGSYFYTVTDSEGCTSAGVALMNEPDSIRLFMTGMDASCVELGSASVFANGGTGDIIYEWSTGETTTDINGLSTGTYTVTATDENGCEGSDEIEITGALGPDVNISIDQPVSENNPNSGQLTANVMGGTAPFDYNWSNGGTTASIDSLPSGAYLVTVTDVNGCTTVDSAYLFVAACTGGKIWNDLNRDGCQDGGELGMHGVTLTLTGTDIWGNAIVDTTTSTINGEYIFENLPPGDYQVHIQVPDDYGLSPVDNCDDDTKDSDFDGNGTSYTINLTEGHCCLIVDGGLYDDCLNVTDPGTICCDQVLCGPGNDPAPLTATPAQGANQIQYMWIYSHEPSPPGIGNGAWKPVLDAFGNPVMTAEYDPVALSQTTYFARCTRAVGCDNWLETNAVAITVESEAVAAIDEPGAICVGNAITFTAAPNSTNAAYHWNFGPYATPSTSTDPSPTVVWNQAGYLTISLTVYDNDCVSHDELLIAVSNDPVYCGTALVAPDDNSGIANGQAIGLGKIGEVTIYPNPVSDKLNVKWDTVQDAPVSIELLAITGQVVLQHSTPANDLRYDLDVADVRPGVYMLRVRTADGEVGVFRVVKR